MKSPKTIYTDPRPSNRKYPYHVSTQLSQEQKDFITSECEKLSCSIAEYIRTLIDDMIMLSEG